MCVHVIQQLYTVLLPYWTVLTLDDVRAKEMADIVSRINSNATGKSHLDAILKEADEAWEGRYLKRAIFAGMAYEPALAIKCTCSTREQKFEATWYVNIYSCFINNLYNLWTCY